MNNEIKAPGGVLVKSMGFSLALVLLFTLVANLLPQVEGEAPVDQEVDLGALTMDSYVALGETLFSGKGTCALCHNDLGRAPDILAINMVEVAKQHLQDERYKGPATDVESYLYESLVDPGVYVVKDYGKKGSNDTISPMPAVDKSPIELSEIEINAIIAFMQAKDGYDVTVSLPTEAPAAEPTSPEVVESAGTIEEVVAKYSCQACHVILGSGGDLGPGLEQMAGHFTREEIRQGIIAPDEVIAEGFPPGVMPQDLAEQMTVKELDILVDYLASHGKSTATPPAATSSEGAVDSSAESMISSFGCQACHAILGSGGKLGPGLDGIGSRLNAEEIRQSIIDPNAVIAKGFPSGVMPLNYSEQMSEEQLDALVAFLWERK
ncbi:MAG: c-type cytochrome [Gammaproteobacteria bacterium]|nr:c-type cytochrome [Gammaproteobacteria bacterium]